LTPKPNPASIPRAHDETEDYDNNHNNNYDKLAGLMGKSFASDPSRQMTRHFGAIRRGRQP